MIAIQGPRNSGRTTKLVSLVVNDSKGAIFTHSSQEAWYIRRKFPQIADRVFEFDKRNHACGSIENAYVDNVDHMDLMELGLLSCNFKIEAMVFDEEVSNGR